MRWWSSGGRERSGEERAGMVVVWYKSYNALGLWRV